MRPSPCGRRASQPRPGLFQEETSSKAKQSLEQPHSTSPPHMVLSNKTPTRLFIKGQIAGRWTASWGWRRGRRRSLARGVVLLDTREASVLASSPGSPGVGRRQDGPLGLKNIPFPGDGALPAEPFFPGQLLALQWEEAGACVGRGEALTPRRHG